MRSIDSSAEQTSLEKDPEEFNSQNDRNFRKSVKFNGNKYNFNQKEKNAHIRHPHSTNSRSKTEQEYEFITIL
jgi:hypothetical protein